MSRDYCDARCDSGDWDSMCRTCRDEALADDRQSRAEADR